MSRKIFESMELLYERAHPHLDTEELLELAQLAEAASDQAARMADVCAAMANRIAEPAVIARPHGEPDTFTLLNTLAHSFDTLAGMTYLADRAFFAALKRRAGEEG